MSSADGFDELFVGFCQALRAAHLPIGADDSVTFLAALEQLDTTDLMDVYWSGRTALVRKRDHVAAYNAVFRDYFLDERPEASDARKRMLKASSKDRKSTRLNSSH